MSDVKYFDGNSWLSLKGPKGDSGIPSSNLPLLEEDLSPEDEFLVLHAGLPFKLTFGSLLENIWKNTIFSNRYHQENVTDERIIDSISTTEFTTTKWIYIISLASDETTRQSGEILAAHNGTATQEATLVQFNNQGRVRFGTPINGLLINIDVSGIGIHQKMNFKVSSDDPVNVSVVRVIFGTLLENLYQIVTTTTTTSTFIPVP